MRSNANRLAEEFGGVAERAQRTRNRPDFFRCEHQAKRVTEDPKQGGGTELRGIGNVAYRLSKLKAQDEIVTFLHRTMFKRPGKVSTRKKAVLSFSGFAFSATEQVSELQKVKDKTAQLSVKLLDSIINLFDLPKSLKNKEEKVDSIVSFLECPTALSNVDASQQVPKRRKKTNQAKQKSASKRKAPETPMEDEDSGDAKPVPKKRSHDNRKGKEDQDDADMSEPSKEPAASDADESDDPAPTAGDEMERHPKNGVEGSDQILEEEKQTQEKAKKSMSEKETAGTGTSLESPDDNKHDEKNEDQAEGERVEAD